MGNLARPLMRILVRLRHLCKEDECRRLLYTGLDGWYVYYALFIFIENS
jgi:hypothetical protein